MANRFCFVLLFIFTLPCNAHHVLGRPAYSLSEDSNTPPSMQVETQIGDYFITYMVFPAFPKPGEGGRVNLYASRIDDGETFQGEVDFSVRDDAFLSELIGNSPSEHLGTQQIDDGVYRQSFIFKNAGDYLVSASFESRGEPYIIDFPLRIGSPSPIGPIGIAIVIIVLVLVGVTIIQRKQLTHTKVQNANRGKY
jgi:hypothetical protein